MVTELGFVSLRLVSGRGPIDKLSRDDRRELGIPGNSLWLPSEPIELEPDKRIDKATTNYYGTQTHIVSDAGGSAWVNLEPDGNKALLKTEAKVRGRRRVTSSLSIERYPVPYSLTLGVDVAWPKLWPESRQSMGSLSAKLNPHGGVVGKVEIPRNYRWIGAGIKGMPGKRGWVKHLGIDKETIPDFSGRRSREEEGGWYTYARDNRIPSNQRDLQDRFMQKVAERLGIADKWGQPIDVVATIHKAIKTLGVTDAIVFKD